MTCAFGGSARAGRRQVTMKETTAKSTNSTSSRIVNCQRRLLDATAAAVDGGVAAEGAGQAGAP